MFAATVCSHGDMRLQLPNIHLHDLFIVLGDSKSNVKDADTYLCCCLCVVVIM